MISVESAATASGSRGWQIQPAVARAQAVPEILRWLHAAQGAEASLALARSGVVVVIDGPSGAGKSHLASELAAALQTTGAPLQGAVRLDELVPGWDGLAAGVKAGGAILRSLNLSKPARARKWDWAASCSGDWLVLPPLDGGVLLLEGCGTLACAAQDLPHLALLRLWVQAPPEVRLERVRQRDTYSWDLRAWQSQAQQQDEVWQQGPPQYWPDLLVAG